jgi:hypothetical protein
MKTFLLIRRAQNFLSTGPCAAALAVLLFAGPLQGEERSGYTEWTSWSFTWEVKDGAALGIRDVYYKHKLVIKKANMPVIRTEYNDWEEPSCVDPPCPHHCDGTPTAYVDRISWDDLTNSVKFCGKTFSCRTTFPTCGSTKVYQQSYWITGPRSSRQWLEIGAFADLLIGGQTARPLNPHSSRMHMGWRLSEDGFIEPFLKTAGTIKCDHNHTNHVYWRIDFDVNGPEADQVWVIDGPIISTSTGTQYTRERNDVKNLATSRYWYVRDAPTGHGVYIFPGRNDGVKSGFSTLDVGVRLNKSPEEGVPWPGAVSEELGYMTPAENIAEKNIVFWYVSHSGHFDTPTHPGCIWYSTGPTFKVNWPFIR